MAWNFLVFLAFIVFKCYNISVKAVQKIDKKIFRIALTAALALFAVLLVGCSRRDVEIVLSRTELSLAVGESRSILPYVSFAPATSGGTIKLTSDSDSVAIDGTTVVAVKSGTANVKISAYGKSAVIKINVKYRDITDITDFTVTAENGVQTASDGIFKTVVLTAAIDGGENRQSDVQWQVNDGATFTGNRFEYTPAGYGEYIVTATLGDMVRSYDVKVYRPTRVTVGHTSLNDVNAYSTVTFTAYEEVNSLNPRSVYRWFVNGIFTCDRPTFDFIPSVGRYDISLTVNGEQKQIDGNNKAVIEIESDTYTDCVVEFDDVDGVYVRYAKERKVLSVSVIAPDGKRSIFDVTDAQHAHLFASGSFRATDYITVCAQDPKQYTVIIGMDGDRHEFVFSQLGVNVVSYLDDKVLCRNSFISSDSEAAQYVRELYATGAQSGECYAAIDAEHVEQIIARQAELLELNVTTATDGNVITLDFEPYANKPEKYESTSKNISYAMLPHIEYNSEKRRANDYVFSSDRAVHSVAVRGSEQLLIAISNRLKPVTQSGDVAHTVYRMAKTILLRTIGKDYTPVQKVHAIYDWLQWVTVNASVDSDSAGRFLEGVFANIDSSGSYQDPSYMVSSDGVAKVFALLCGIEGIECVICHCADYGYYNKVKLDGLWYNVDVFGGKLVIANASNTGVTTSVQFTSHLGLLINDRELSRLGCTVNDGYDAFDPTYSLYMQKYAVDGKYIDYYIDKSEVAYEPIRAAVFHAFDAVLRGNTSIPFVGGVQIKNNDTYGVELACDIDMTEEEMGKISAFVNKAIDEYASEVLNTEFASRRTIIADGFICAVAVPSRTAAQ